MKISKYKSIIFDCDGVILNSNKIKTDAFKAATSSFGEEASNRLVEYHLMNGGISRYHKFDYFLSSILKSDFNENKQAILTQLLETYAENTYRGLLTSQITFGLKNFRDITKGQSWMIVSGGDQNELISVFKIKEISEFFDSGIYGSPDTKNQILGREIRNGNIKFPALFLGDSRLDHEVATLHGLDFIFVSAWTEFSLFDSYCKTNSISVISKVYDLLNLS